MAELRELAGARERELDLLEYELAEIDALAPSEGEHEQLLGARERLRRLDALRSAAGAGADALAGESPDAPVFSQVLARACAGLDALAGVDPRLDLLAERMRALEIEAGDLAAELRDYCERSVAEPSEGMTGPLGGRELSLDALEERLAAIERLARKHGGSISAVLQYAEHARLRAQQLAGAEDALEGALEELRVAQAALDQRVLALRRARRSAAPRLARGVREQLAALAMAEASFDVVVCDGQPGPGGGDAVELLIAPNPGVPAAPLREIASGGELSRVMLAILTPPAPRPLLRRTRSSSTRLTPVSADIPREPSALVCRRSGRLARCCASLTCPRSPHSASATSRSSRTRARSPRARASCSSTSREVLAELVRMLGADSDDTAARRHARDLRRAA